MYCNYCGKQIPDDAQLCAYCGKRVAGAVAVRKRLTRAREGRKIAGVCQGVAEYFDVDVTLVRILWVVAAFCGLLGGIAYIVAWIVMPEAPLALNAAPAAEPNKAVNM